jgi:adenosylmethionine-8-amino-7-oxononanoate aminotransferase
MEAALKLARQHYLESNPPQPQRTKFIARHESYHGTTLGALSVSGHKARRAPYEPMLLPNMSRVSACNAYRGMAKDETEAEYVDRLAKELDDEFQRLGPKTVCAFVAEPVVGAVSESTPILDTY